MSESNESPSPTALLKNLRIAAPCSENWEAMPGSDRVRSCDRCQHRVYNLSEMSSAEAADLLRKSEGRVCVRFYRRADGTVMTKDCPVGLRAIRQRVARATSIAFASVAVACGASFIGKSRAEQPTWVQWVLNNATPTETAPLPEGPIELPMAPAVTVEPAEPAIMGRIAAPSPTSGLLLGEITISESKRQLMHGAEDDVRPSQRQDPFLKLRSANKKSDTK